MTKRSSLSFVAASLLLGGGCASQAAADHSAAPASQATKAGGVTTRAVELPTAVGAGAPNEVVVLIDEPGLKLATITLRGGTVLPEHAAPSPVTIVALDGSGTVTAEGQRLPLGRGQAVVLAAGVSHLVTPDGGADLVLLVHHLGAVADGSHP